jgi:hypothetical protein
VRRPAAAAAAAAQHRGPEQLQQPVAGLLATVAPIIMRAGLLDLASQAATRAACCSGA